LPEAIVTDGLTVRGAINQAAATLAAAGCDAPWLDASILLASVLGVERARLVTEAHAVLEADARSAFEALVARRAAREPVAYILGVKWFRRLSLVVDPRVLIPRPESELLVEAALSLPAGAAVVDVGTGSGAVALAVKDERPDLIVSGIDMDPAAVDVASANAARLNLDVSFSVGDLLGGRRADAVLANLPYVADGFDVAPEIRDWEPGGAVFGGPDGLDAIRRLVASLAGVPFVALEIGFDQGDAVAGLLSGAGYTSVERRRDLAGHERVVVGRR
jgi:release factor glutamine methyltransferase